MYSSFKILAVAIIFHSNLIPINSSMLRSAKISENQTICHRLPTYGSESNVAAKAAAIAHMPSPKSRARKIFSVMLAKVEVNGKF